MIWRGLKKNGTKEFEENFEDAFGKYFGKINEYPTPHLMCEMATFFAKYRYEEGNNYEKLVQILKKENLLGSTVLG